MKTRSTQNKGCIKEILCVRVGQNFETAIGLLYLGEKTVILGDFIAKFIYGEYGCSHLFLLSDQRAHYGESNPDDDKGVSCASSCPKKEKDEEAEAAEPLSRD